MNKLTEEQVDETFDVLNGFDLEKDKKYQFHCWAPMDYRGCYMVLRNLKIKGGIIFEFLLVYEGKIYQNSQLITSKKYIKKSEIEVQYANLYAMATATIDTLIKMAKEKEEKAVADMMSGKKT